MVIRHRSALALLFSGFCLAATALGGEAVENGKMEYRKSVKAGEVFRLRVPAPDGDAPTVYTFNGEVRTLPPGLRYYRAETHQEKYTQLVDGAVQATSKYQTLARFPFPEDGKTYSVWVRYRNGPFNFRRPEKEISWVWGTPADFVWQFIGRYDAETVGPVMTVMGGPGEPFTVLDAVLVTLATENEYRPDNHLAGDPLVFEWKPNAAMVGAHDFKLVVESEGRKTERTVNVTVTPAGEAHAPEPADDAAAVHVPRERQFALRPDAPPPDAAAVPLLSFRDDDYRARLREAPAGLSFDTDFFYPLRCRAYPELPEEATISVGRTLGGLALLLTQYWQGEVDQEMAHIRVEYRDGKTERIPLREEMELCGSLRHRAPRNAFYLGTLVTPAMEFHLTVAAWKNPRPDEPVERLVFSNVRLTFSKEENKEIPLNVAGDSSQILLGAIGLASADDAEKLTTSFARRAAEDSADVDVAVDFGRPERPINPFVFSTNETDVLEPWSGFDEYLERMREVGCRIIRLHSGWSLEKIYPNQLEKPNYQLVDDILRRMQAALPGVEIMPCLNYVPSYVDPKTEAGRELFATLAADLVRELNIKRGLKLRYWEIFNEVYFQKIDEDRALWHMYNLTARKMKEVDPTIKIGGYAPCWPVVGHLRDFYTHCHENTDFVSWHKYPTGSVRTSTEYLMRETASFGEDARRVRAMIEAVTPGKPVELALTEYNINYNWKPHDPRQATQVGAAWLASVLHHLVKAGVDIAQTWHSRGGGTFGLFSGQNEPRPTAKLLMIANRHIRGTQVWSHATGSSVECLAFRDDDGRAAGLMLVNKSGAARRVKVSLMNPPRFRAGVLEPNTLVYRLAEAGMTKTYEDIRSADGVSQVELSPYEVRVWIDDIQL